MSRPGGRRAAGPSCAVALTGLLLLAGAGPAPPADLPAHPGMIEWPETAVKLPLDGVQRVELESGPVVYLAADPSLPLVEIAVALRVGSLHDPADLTGLGSLTGAMIRRGGAGELEAGSLDLEIDDLGARIDTSAGTTRGGASLSVLTDRLEPALALFFQVLRAPTFQEDRLENARKNLLESMGRRNQDPLEVREREWEWLLYGDRHFSTRPLTAASVAALRREHLVEYHRRYWRPERMVVAVSGDFSQPDLLARLEAGFAGWPAPGEAPGGPERRWPPDPPAPAAAPGLYHYELPAAQAKVAFGRRLESLLPWHHPDRPALALLAEILGGTGAISRLGGRLRTAEGLVYRISALVEPGRFWPGEVRIDFETAAGSVVPALEAALEEIDRLRRRPVHPTELEVARRTLLSRLLLDLDTAEEVAGRAAENELLGRPSDYWQRFRQGLERVGSEDVRRLADEVLDPERFVFLVVGPDDGLARLGTRVERLPRRDPVTMAPVVASSSGR